MGVDFRSTIEWLQGCGKVGEWIGTTVYACCACQPRLVGKENAMRRGRGGQTHAVRWRMSFRVQREI